MLWLSLLVTSLLSVFAFALVWVAWQRHQKNAKEMQKNKLYPPSKHPRLKTLKAGMLVIIIGGSILFPSFYIGNRIAFMRSVVGVARWVDSNGQSYLYVEAESPYDLGYLTGINLADQIIRLKILLSIMALAQGLNYFENERLCLEYLPYIPTQYQQELQGMADAATAQSGFLITFTDALLQAVFFDLFYGRITPTLGKESKTLGCTALGVNNTGGLVVIGQNIDLLKLFAPVQAFVLHKLGDDPLVFTHRFGACPAMPIGKNEFGITIVMNLVQTIEIAPITTPVFVRIRDGLAHNHTAEELFQGLVTSGPSSYSRNFIIADNMGLIATQVLPTNITKTMPSNVTYTNTFLDPFWQGKLADPLYSKDRQNYAASSLADALENGEFTEEELLSILRDAPVICRDEESLTGTATVAFMTRSHFGIGTPRGMVGDIPI